MARKLRLQYEGAIYHVMSRGDRREPIFLDDADRKRFLETLEEACAKTGWQVHAYCLMLNHFHLVVETPQANLVAGMKWLLGTYTSRFNRRHHYFGHLFSGRYKSLLVDGSGNGYLATVSDYVHLNPVRARLLKKEDKLESFAWSSYPAYLKPPAQRPAYLRVDRVLGEHGIRKESAAGRREFATRMEMRRFEEDDESYHKLRRGWCLGSAEFKAELLEAMDGQASEQHGGPEKRECEEERAHRILGEGLRALGWREKDLGTKRKCDPGKIQLATKLRAETTMTLKWVAEKLKMGTWTNVSSLLYHAGQKGAKL